MNTYIGAYALTMTVAPSCFHQPVVLVIACHGLISIALPTLLDVPRNFQSQDIFHPVSLRQDAVRPVAHRPGIVLVTGTVLGLAQRVHLGVLALVFLLTPPWQAQREEVIMWDYLVLQDIFEFYWHEVDGHVREGSISSIANLQMQLRYQLIVLLPPINVLFLMRTPTQSTVQEENLDQLVSWQSSWQGSWHDWVMLGMASVNSRQSLTSACVPFSWRQDRAEG